MSPEFSAMLYPSRQDLYILEITPHPSFSLQKKKVVLSKAQYELGFVPWLEKRKSISEAFPTFPAAIRELFITGMNTKEFNKYMKSAA